MDKMNESAPTVFPVSPSDIGIHVAYIRRDIDQIKKDHSDAHKELQSTLKELVDNTPTRGEFEDLKTLVGTKANTIDKQQEAIDAIKGDRKWIMGAAAVLILLQGALMLLARLYIQSVVTETIKTSLAQFNITVQ